MSIFTENLKRLRERENLKQSELAEMIGVTNKAISSWEKGRTEPNMGMIEKLCVALNCTKSDLMEEQPTILMTSDAQVKRLLMYAEKLGMLKQEARERVFEYIEFEKSKEERKNAQS